MPFLDNEHKTLAIGTSPVCHFVSHPDCLNSWIRDLCALITLTTQSLILTCRGGMNGYRIILTVAVLRSSDLSVRVA
jgi:hypothetical protein